MSPSADPGQITILLRRVSEGDPLAESALIGYVYPDLRRLAANYLRKERRDHTLQPTALVHEAFLKLAGDSGALQDRGHFFRLASKIMRQILVDHARKRRTSRRGGDRVKVPLNEAIHLLPEESDLVIDLDDALDRLQKFDERQAQVVEMRFFGGLSEEDIASSLGISSRTVKREWAMAKAWLHGELGTHTPPPIAP